MQPLGGAATQRRVGSVRFTLASPGEMFRHAAVVNVTDAAVFDSKTPSPAQPLARALDLSDAKDQCGFVPDVFVNAMSFPSEEGWFARVLRDMTVRRRCVFCGVGRFGSSEGCSKCAKPAEIVIEPKRDLDGPLATRIAAFLGRSVPVELPVEETKILRSRPPMTAYQFARLEQAKDKQRDLAMYRACYGDTDWVVTVGAPLPDRALLPASVESPVCSTEETKKEIAAVKMRLKGKASQRVDDELKAEKLRGRGDRLRKKLQAKRGGM